MAQQTAPKKGYKWIAEEIERLDPEVDYEEIWKLSTCYYVNDFMMNFLYTTGMPHFILPPHGGETVTRGGSGKVIKQQDKREKDTADHFWTWFEFGPSKVETQVSMDKVNKIHAEIWKRMPGNFSHIDDFIYTMCWIGADMHRLRLRIGLSGFTEKQQIACHRFWLEIAKLFVCETGPIVQDFPANFQGMLDYMERYEAVQYEFSPEGAQACEALLEQFANRWFPKGFRWFGRNMILSMLDEPIRRTHRLKKPDPVTIKLNEFGLKMVLWGKERVLPDPKITTPEKHRRKATRAAGRPAAASAA
jgi:hypothetical protein